MGITADFTAGLAQVLEDATVGAWRPTGQYTSAETAIIPGQVPSKPDRLITLTVYGYVDDPTEPESTLLLQLRTRGDRDIRTSENTQDAAFDVLQNLPRREVGGVIVAACFARGSRNAYLGVDENGRHSHSSNYEFRIHLPTTFRR